MSKLLSMLMKSKGGGSQIEYLQSDGAIYIPLCESGETLNVKSFKIDIEFLEETGSTPNIYIGYIYYVYGSNQTIAILRQSFWQAETVTGLVVNGGATISPNINLTQRENYIVTFNNTKTFNNNFGIFGGYYEGSATSKFVYGKCKIWSCILYDGDGNEVANLLPKEENGVLGMYDSARNKFIAGVGSGSFIAG